jgi:hypothetical protein
MICDWEKLGKRERFGGNGQKEKASGSGSELGKRDARDFLRIKIEMGT